MATTKKKAKKQAETAAPYAKRLLEDRYVQEQLQSAVAGLRGAYGRVRRRGTSAAEDKKLYGNLRQAASSIRNVATAMQRPKPQPKRRLQKVAAAGLAAGSAVLVARQQKGRPGSGGGSASSG
jgi:hypothetical protein